MPVSPIPEGYHTPTPYLIVKNASDALAFYARAFGASELCRLPGPAGKVGHAEMRIGNSVFMLADEVPEIGAVAPVEGGGHAVSFLFYVPDVDAAVGRAADAGCRLVRPVQDQFFGDRSGTIVDPFGHQWTLATHIEDVPPDEMKRRLETMAKRAPSDA